MATTSVLTEGERVREAIASIKDEGELVDAIADIRGWFSSPGAANNAIKAYMAHMQDVQTTVSQLADPVDELYSSAEHGRALQRAERIAANQRPLLSKEEAEERWGLPQQFPELLEPEEENDDDEDDTRTVEGLLWQLWFSVLHNARKTPWNDDAAQDRLIDLVRVVKQRPDPPLPANATKALRRDWMWSSGHVWSQLAMLGPSAREHWNDSPGVGAGYTDVEVRGWLNVNSFVARLTISGVANFWRYCIWALRAALERDPPPNDDDDDDRRASGAEKLGIGISEVAVWMRVAGRQMWEHVLCNSRADEVQYIDPEMPFKELPWRVHERDYQSDGFTMTRWLYWKARLLWLAKKQTLTDGAKYTAARTAQLMETIEQSKQDTGTQ